MRSGNVPYDGGLVLSGHTDPFVGYLRMSDLDRRINTGPTVWSVEWVFSEDLRLPARVESIACHSTGTASPCRRPETGTEETRRTPSPTGDARQ